jgi:hypothetical protein
MASTSITNRNLWTEKEDNTLLSNVANYATKKLAHETSARELGRSVTACTQRYNVIKSKKAENVQLTTEDIKTLINAGLKQQEGLLLQEITHAILRGLNPSQVANYKFLLDHINLFK